MKVGNNSIARQADRGSLSSLLLLGVGVRAVIAAVCAAVLWTAVAWALH